MRRGGVFRRPVEIPAGQEWPWRRTLTARQCGVFVMRPVSSIAQSAPISPPPDSVLRVLKLLADGKTTQEVAAELGVHPGTVKNRIREVSYLLKRHGLMEDIQGPCGRAGLVGQALRLEWIS